VNEDIGVLPQHLAKQVALVPKGAVETVAADVRGLDDVLKRGVLVSLFPKNVQGLLKSLLGFELARSRHRLRMHIL
jgi:hypothetical protein